MNIREIISQVRETIDDKKEKKVTDALLLSFINEATASISKELKTFINYAIRDLIKDKQTYKLPNGFLSLIEIRVNDDYLSQEKYLIHGNYLELLDNINEDKTDGLYIKYYAIPEEIILNRS